MSAQPGGQWKNRSAKLCRSMGFVVDDRCYPWVAYKGERFRPTEWHYIKTDEELEARALRQKHSREANQRRATGKLVQDETEVTAFVVCNQRAYEVPKDVADELKSLRDELKASW